ncbi:MAG: TetR/AcrR family transcriptional regulator [Bacteroidales bacterium]|nr:TetR/AcrR family transcriptional regulator [Bacteroidales bacterium]MBS3776926.1 TetR/AcrR family transcriptional regulator [Bacteroidales bacterium]
MNQEYQHIIEKTSELYNQYGIKSITMDDVARELGMSKKTLYKYVSNKDDLVDHFVEYLTENRNCNVEEIKKQKLNAIEELVEVNEYVIEMLKNYNPSTDYDLKKYYPDHYRKLRKLRQNNMYQAVKENIMKGKDEGLYRQELDEDIISRVHVSRIENSFANEMFTIQELTSWKFIREMMIYHIHGIANAEGVKIFYNKLKEFENKKDLY